MTLYVVQAPGAEAEALAKARFVKDGFSKPAFVFAPLWLLYHRLWLAFGVWVLLDVAFVVFVLPHVGMTTTALVDVIARIFIGLEGNSLRCRKDAVVTDVVDARDRDEAETIFYRRHLDPPLAQSPT